MSPKDAAPLHPFRKQTYTLGPSSIPRRPILTILTRMHRWPSFLAIMHAILMPHSNHFPDLIHRPRRQLGSPF